MATCYSWVYTCVTGYLVWKSKVSVSYLFFIFLNKYVWINYKNTVHIQMSLSCLFLQTELGLLFHICKHKFGVPAQFWWPERQRLMSSQAAGRQNCQSRASRSLVEDIDLSLELCMRLKKFEKCGGIRLWPPRPTTDMTLWPDLLPWSSGNCLKRNTLWPFSHWGPKTGILISLSPKVFSTTTW